MKLIKIDRVKFSFKELCFVLAPFVLIWLIFLGIFHDAYIRNILSSIQLILSTPSHAAESLISINWEAMKYILAVTIFMVACIVSLRLPGTSYAVSTLIILGIIMYAIIETSLFGLITPFYKGLFGKPMWLSALQVSSCIFLACFFIYGLLKSKQWEDIEFLALLLLIPTVIMAVSSSIFSGLGILTVLHCSIPAISAVVCMTLSKKILGMKSYIEKTIILVIFLAPFYASTALFDWNFSFFDVAPAQASVEIDRGFGKGIRTNHIYKNLYNWIDMTSEKYSDKDDYIISYITSPMVHMIARRRPALDECFIDFMEVPADYYDNAMEFMRKANREPRLVYVFEAIPAIVKISENNSGPIWFNKQFAFPGKDPISRYVFENMLPIDSFRINDQFIVRCCIDRSYILEEKLENDPSNTDLMFQLGNYHQKRGDYKRAADYYKQVLNINPESIPALHHLAISYSLSGKADSAIAALKEILKIEPADKNASYNLACLYAKQNNREESVGWLKKSIENGFNDWELIRKDPDLDSIRNTPYVIGLIKNKGTKKENN